MLTASTTITSLCKAKMKLNTTIKGTNFIVTSGYSHSILSTCGNFSDLDSKEASVKEALEASQCDQKAILLRDNDKVTFDFHSATTKLNLSLMVSVFDTIPVYHRCLLRNISECVICVGWIYFVEKVKVVLFCVHRIERR